ncbi:hypothetical protein LTR74_009274 [Friedmanniomyces endolithicus]|nr:hypothetical protein LTR74_009274 [Friedmanniomyces endolithicus]
MPVPEVIEIAPHGDVLLVCGEQVDGAKITCLRVDSHIMSFGSPVFKTLLASGFKEGSTLATSTMVEIPLPEDIPEHMAMLCNIFHMRSDCVSQLNLSSLQGLAQLCDKYDCAPAAKPTVDSYFLSKLPDAPVSMLEDYLGAAVKLRCTNAVKRIAVSIVHQSTDPITETAEAKDVPLGFICAMINTMFREAHRTISVLIDHFIEQQLFDRAMNSGCETRCSVSPMRVRSLLTQLRGCKLWGNPTGHVKLETKLGAMESLHLHDPADLSACGRPGGFCTQDYNILKLSACEDTFLKKATEIRRMVEAMDFSELGNAS